MLTLILLVVFAGGGGLLAIWLIDQDSLAPLAKRLDLRSLRGDREPGTTTTAGDQAPDPSDVPDAEAHATMAVPVEPEPEPEPAPAMVVVGAPEEAPRFEPLPAPAPRRRTRRGGPVPAAFTAIEGTYAEVARVPPWRKALSLVLIFGLLVGAGVALAALLAGGLAVGAGLLDRAIG